jgi:hypothetical protein
MARPPIVVADLGMYVVVGGHLHHLVEGGVGDAQAHQQTLVHVYHLLNIIIIVQAFDSLSNRSLI